ncbi:MAG: hypothetical protein ACREE9_01275 [Stellaceae bacterium]
MLDLSTIAETVEKVAKSHLKPIVIRALAEPAIDSEGREALRVTIVIQPDAAGRLEGDAILDTLVHIQDRLREAGEERFAIVQYATEDELETGGDSQS